MSTKKHKIIAVTLMALLISSMVVPAANSQAPEPTQSYKPVSDFDGHALAASEGGDFIIEGTTEGAACREATLEESKALAQRDQLAPLHLISPVNQDGVSSQGAGLSIILRGTPQLENFPQAKQAFISAAQSWESLIQTPITVIIDVDFGATRFGVPYPNPNILGSTISQFIGASSVYPEVRSRLIAQAAGQRESEVYSGLPQSSVRTDIGTTSGLLAPSALFRAVGLLDPVADPASETADFGPPPSIGFNSSFVFDFDPNDGIDSNKTDFDAVAVHELGHALGFSSLAGNLELNSGANLRLTFLDLFRFRPGVTDATFPTASRIMSSGGSQVFFAGTSELALSTGRPDASGGDGRQSSHWKDDDLSGQYLGIMDPVINQGTRYAISDNDLLAFDSLGYQVRVPGGGTDTKELTSGIPQQGSIRAPVVGEDAVIDDNQYTVRVPNGASQLTVELDGNQDVDLYVRAGQRITISSSGLEADYVSDSPTGHESVAVSPSSSPPLRVSTYYIAVLNFGPGAASFNVKATITGGAGGNSSPVITSLKADLDGDDLTLTGVVEDSDGDIIQAKSGLLDGSGEVVGSTDPFGVSFGSSTTINFILTINNLNAIPSAVFASLTFIDRRGNNSEPKVADFGNADSGGPNVSNASHNGSKLVIKGSNFGAQVLIEINGRVLGITPSSSNKKLKVKGDATRLNLRAGANRLRIYNGSLRSNLFVLNR